MDQKFAAIAAAALLAIIPASAILPDPLRHLVMLGLAVLGAVMAVLAVTYAIPAYRIEERHLPNSGKTTKDEVISWTDIIAAMPDPTIVLDASSNIISHNSTARLTFDRIRLGIPLEHINRDPELIAAVSNAFEKSERRSVRLVQRAGSDQRLTATIAPLGSKADHPPPAVLISIRDQSEQHRLLEMRSDFIANASHELRTPLASVRGFIETLQGPAKNDPVAHDRFLSIMADQAERMTRLIDDLLLLSRVEEKANLKPIGRVDLGDLIDEVVNSITPIAAERNATITVGSSPDNLFVNGDRDELFQVFQNLIENAVKYGHDGGTVRLDIAKSKGSTVRLERAIVTIADNGPGIPPEHLPRLTERFYRVNADQSRRIGGTGLGLAIVKHVLNRHEAELHVESIVGTGTTFRVVLQVQ